jgi:hypothetical protein
MQDIHTQHVTTLTFRTTRRQLRGLAIFTAVLTCLAIGIGVIAGTSARGLGAWSIGCEIGALIGVYCLVLYAVIFTKCTPEALCTRNLSGRLHVLPWPQVADITVRAVTSRGTTTYTVLVTSVTGKRFRLGAPVSGGVMSDPEFAAKVQQIQEYWRAATGSADTSAFEPGPQAAAAGTARGIRLDARPAPAVKFARWSVRVTGLVGALVLIGVPAGGIGPGWEAHLGHGERGTFTAYASNCGQSPCTWFGTFTGADGVSVNGLQISDGSGIQRIGQVVPAIKVAGNGLIYPGDGGTQWISLSLLMASGFVLLGLYAFFWTRSLRRRAARRRALAS